MHVNKRAWERAWSGCFPLWTCSSSWNKISTFSRLEEGTAPGITPVILSASDNKHFSTFISWLCLFGFALAKTLAHCVQLQEVLWQKSKEGTRREIGACEPLQWDGETMETYRDIVHSTPLPSTLSSRAATVWRTLHKQSCVWRK